MPPLAPVTVPVLLTVATPGDKEVHVPPPVASLSDVVVPAHNIAVPVIAAGVGGNGFTVTIIVAAAPPQPFVSV